jgi:4'-phosphopantetheinyl transferase
VLEPEKRDRCADARKRLREIIRVPRANEVDVWVARLAAPEQCLGAYQRLLSPDELTRSNRYVFPRIRRSFILGRGALRLLLGHCTGLDPSAVEFVYNELGKPWLASEDLSFNVSHSGDIFACAIAASKQASVGVGLDIEEIRDLPDIESLASQTLSAHEMDEWKNLPREAKLPSFFQSWTCKEAVLKATGDGLAGGLATVTVQPGGKVSFARGALRQVPLHVRSFLPYPGYAGAIASLERPSELRLREFDLLDLLDSAF